MAYSSIAKPTDYFETKLWSGNATDDRAISGLDFAPDWVWIKNRTDTNSHAIFDTIRGATKYIESDTTDAEATGSTFLKSFTSDGFTLGTAGRVNSSGNNYVGWSWSAGGTASSNTDGSITSTVSANTTAGFSIVSYTGTGSTSTVGHGLGSTPKMIIIKDRDTGTHSWVVGHDSLAWTSYLLLNDTDAKGTATTIWNDTAPTSSVFTLGTNVGMNGSGSSQIAYCFAEKTGYSKFGSYTGNGNADGTFVYTGFKPALVIIKETSDTGHWCMSDNKRDGYNPTKNIYADLSNIENTANTVDHYSNGFKIRSTGGSVNTSGSNMIYMAFAENPFVGNDSGTAVPVTAR